MFLSVSDFFILLPLFVFLRFAFCGGAEVGTSSSTLFPIVSVNIGKKVTALPGDDDSERVFVHRSNPKVYLHHFKGAVKRAPSQRQHVFRRHCYRLHVRGYCCCLLCCAMAILAPRIDHILRPDPYCSDPWHALLVHEIAAIDSKDSSSRDDLLTFLGQFFSQQVVNAISDHLSYLEDSPIGESYAWKEGFQCFSLKVVDELVKMFPSWAEVVKANVGNNNNSSGGYVDEFMRAGGHGSRGNGNSGPGKDPTMTSSDGGLAYFSIVPRIVIHNKTPPKGPVPDQNRLLGIKERTRSFGRSVLDLGHTYPHCNPASCNEDMVYLFHGTRVEDWNTSFTVLGIDPREVPNEFCSRAAFYTVNSLEQAFLHVSHNRPSLYVDGENRVIRSEPNLIAVLVFQVPSQLFISRGQSNLTVKYFPDDDTRWFNFCRDNLARCLRGEHNDIVIGPICRGDGYTGRIPVAFPGGVPLMQVAFCSENSRRMLEQYLVRVYIEHRDL